MDYIKNEALMGDSFPAGKLKENITVCIGFQLYRCS